MPRMSSVPSVTSAPSATVTACLDGHGVRGVEHVARGDLHLLRAVLAADHLDHTVDLADERLAFRDAGLEQLLDAGETLGDVRTARGDTTGVERPHGELRSRLADGLRRDDADRLADLHETTGCEVASVAHPADTLAGLAGHDAADLHAADRLALAEDATSGLVVDVLAARA